MSIIQVFILSVVEGLTEFLPISSTAHLTLAARILNLPQNNFVKSFEISIQLGAVLAVLCLYHKEVVKNKDILKKITIAFIPTAILGFLAYNLVKNYLLGNQKITALALIIGGLAFIAIEFYIKNNKKPSANIKNIDPKKLLFVSVFQSLSLIPGISRAAASIFGGLVVGLNRAEATKLSFFLAIPTIISATVFDLYKTGPYFSKSEILTILLGIMTSFFFAMMAIKSFIKFIKTHDFYPFGVYRIFIGIIWLLMS